MHSRPHHNQTKKHTSSTPEKKKTRSSHHPSFSQGKTVVELRYEAYVPMAIRCLKSICTTARSTWSLDSSAVAHRLGPVPVQEASVFVAISYVHRADALDACKFIIDELKASVPIWKKCTQMGRSGKKILSSLREGRMMRASLFDYDAGVNASTKVDSSVKYVPASEDEIAAGLERVEQREAGKTLFLDVALFLCR